MPARAWCSSRASSTGSRPRGWSMAWVAGTSASSGFLARSPPRSTRSWAWLASLTGLGPSAMPCPRWSASPRRCTRAASYRPRPRRSPDAPEGGSALRNDPIEELVQRSCRQSDDPVRSTVVQVHDAFVDRVRASEHHVGDVASCLPGLLRLEDRRFGPLQHLARVLEVEQCCAHAVDV